MTKGEESISAHRELREPKDREARVIVVQARSEPLWRRLFSRRDNLLSMITIAAALVVAVMRLSAGIIPDGAVLTSILVLLGLLATSGIIERESRFEKSERQLDDVRHALAGLSAIESEQKSIGKQVEKIKERSFLLSVRQLPPIEQQIAGASELFYAGGHGIGFIHPNSSLLRGWLHDKKALRVILQDPENEGLHHLQMPCTLYEAKAYMTKIESSLDVLKKLKEEFSDGRLDVRLTKVTPTQSVSILDGHLGGTKITALLHLPNGDAATGPFLVLDRDDQPWFGRFFERYYKYLWDNARPFISSEKEEEQRPRGSPP